MTNYSLKSAADIATVNASVAFTGITATRKGQLLARLQSVADDINTVLPVLLGQTSDLTERAYLAALLTATTSSGGSSGGNSSGSSASPSITSVGDGATNSLETLVTVGLAVPRLLSIYDTVHDEPQEWVLETSTAPTAVDGDGKPCVERPLDFNAVTNAKVWFRKR